MPATPAPQAKQKGATEQELDSIAEDVRLAHGDPKKFVKEGGPARLSAHSKHVAEAAAQALAHVKKREAELDGREQSLKGKEQQVDKSMDDLQSKMIEYTRIARPSRE